MKKRFMQFAALLLALAVSVPAVWAAGRGGGNPLVRVGLYYDKNALTSANLQNESGYGDGYRFGYFDQEDELNFVELARTTKKQRAVTMVRASNVYLSGSGFVTQAPSAGAKALGCYHVLLPGRYDDFDQAYQQAQETQGAFVAWIEGEYQVRCGAFETKQEAEQAAQRLDGEVKGTSAYAVNVVATGTTDILFQFDGGGDYDLGVMPDVTGADETRTWFKNLLYRGGFQYGRVGGGDLTVSNVVDEDSYIKGVIPFEMDPKWPLEALKAQAVCARTYGRLKLESSKHASSGFDICNTADCQVYYGMGGPATKKPSDLSDRAVEETSGEYVWYGGALAETYYSSSHGGASEDIYYVWGSSREKYPYLCGVDDPYEQDTNSMNGYSSWQVSYTASQLTQRLRESGFGVGTSLSGLELTYSERGNVIQVKILYENGESNTITPRTKPGIRSAFGVNSIRFTVNGKGASSGTAASPSQSGGGVTVNGSAPLGEGDPYVIGGSGKTIQADREELHVVSGTGTVSALDQGSGSSGSSTQQPTGAKVTVSGGSYTFAGGGWGHQLGMSQFGAYAMAQRGFTYDEIVEFYFPGTYVDDRG